MNRLIDWSIGGYMGIWSIRYKQYGCVSHFIKREFEFTLYLLKVDQKRFLPSPFQFAPILLCRSPGWFYWFIFGSYPPPGSPDWFIFILSGDISGFYFKIDHDHFSHPSQLLAGWCSGSSLDLHSGRTRHSTLLTVWPKFIIFFDFYRRISA